MTPSRRDFVKQAAAVGVALGGGIYLTRARGAPGPTPLRPPGALDEIEFNATCLRCMKCIDACPNRALLPCSDGNGIGLDGTPTLRPRVAACMLCGGQEGEFLKCTEVCPSGALRRVRRDKQDVKDKVAIGTAEIDLDLCYSYNNWSCGACYRACPLAGEALTVGMWERPEVNADVCVGCGCCERSCIRYPHAIRVKPRSA